MSEKTIWINLRAFYTVCGCQSIDLTLYNMANSCDMTLSLFGLLQRVYCLFSSFAKWWGYIYIYRISWTSWIHIEIIIWHSLGGIESVAAIWYKITKIKDVLIHLAETRDDFKIHSETHALFEKKRIISFEFFL